MGKLRADLCTGVNVNRGWCTSFHHWGNWSGQGANCDRIKGKSQREDISWHSWVHREEEQVDSNTWQDQFCCESRRHGPRWFEQWYTPCSGRHLPTNQSYLIEGSPQTGWTDQEVIPWFQIAPQEIRAKYWGCRSLTQKQRWTCWNSCRVRECMVVGTNLLLRQQKAKSTTPLFLGDWSNCWET